MAFKFLNTLTIVSAPARSNAFALSYSQFVPGNTGINTVGLATLFLQMYTLSVLNNPVLTSSLSSVALVGNTFSKVPVQASNASSMEIVISPYTNACLSLTSAISVTNFSIPASFTSACNLETSFTSATILPNPGANNSSFATVSDTVTPSLLPNAILLNASAMPFPSNA